MSKSVSWKASPRERIARSSPQRRKRMGSVSRREQPTWDNCKKDRPMKIRPISRPPSALTSQSVMSSSGASDYSILTWNSLDNNLAITKKRGREIFRQKAVSQLKVNFPTQYVNFDSSDVLKERKRNSPKSSTDLRPDKTEQIRGTKSPVYFINGVSSRAYRRPSLQFGEAQDCLKPTLERKSSEFYLDARDADEKTRQSPELLTFPSATGSSLAPSLSAPATIASNDETIRSTHKKDQPDYLKHDWTSDILSRYSKVRPWTSKYRTNRYFPKQLNLQDVHCRNPYLHPNGLLNNIKCS